MRTMVLLVMHGVPPTDFPRREIGELIGLHARLESGQITAGERQGAEERWRALDARVRSWPRDEDNDRFFAASQQLARELEWASGLQVVLGFNEFCAPSLPEALDETVARGAERVLVITPMMTPGGEHSEVEIPQQIDAARGRHPEVEFRFVWPYEMADVAAFLAGQLAHAGA